MGWLVEPNDVLIGSQKNTTKKKNGIFWWVLRPGGGFKLCGYSWGSGEVGLGNAIWPVYGGF